MSDTVTLTLTTDPTQTLVADCIAADRFAALSALAIAALPVVHGARPATLRSSSASGVSEQASSGSGGIARGSRRSGAAWREASW